MNERKANSAIPNSPTLEMTENLIREGFVVFIVVVVVVVIVFNDDDDDDDDARFAPRL